MEDQLTGIAARRQQSDGVARITTHVPYDPVDAIGEAVFRERQRLERRLGRSLRLYEVNHRATDTVAVIQFVVVDR